MAEIGTDFADKTVLIAGAACDIGCALTSILARHGATVIALDADTTPLRPQASAFPDQVELLTLDPRDGDLARSMGAIWGDEPLHGFVSLLSLAAPDDLVLSCRVPVGLAQAFAPGLQAGQGAALLIWPERGMTPIDVAHRAGIAALADALDREPWAPPGGVHMIELGLRAGADGIAALLVLLCRAQTARLRGGRFRLAQV